MIKNKIITYNTENFRDRFMKPDHKLDAILKPDYGKFFMVKVEELIRLIKLPVPPTRATGHTLIYLTAGEAVMSIGNETYTIYQDECLFVPAGQVYSFNNVDLNKGYLCHFQHDFVVGKFGGSELLNEFEFLHVWGNPRIRLGAQTSGYVTQLVQRIHADYALNGLAHMAMLQAYFIALLCEINTAYIPLSDSKQAQSVMLTNKFKKLVFEHNKTKHRVAEYASLLNITPNHLNKVIRQITGKSPTRWIDETLLMEAKVLLYQTDFSIGEVAEALGMFDASYFSRF